MQKAKQLLIPAALIALAIWGGMTLFPGPEHVIRARLTRLAALGSFEPKDGELVRGYHALEVLDYFTTNVVLSLNPWRADGGTLSGREDLRQLATAATRLSELRIRFLDMAISVDPDRQSATVNLIAAVTLPSDRDPAPHPLVLKMRRLNGKWLITEVTAVKVLGAVRSNSPERWL